MFITSGRHALQLGTLASAPNSGCLMQLQTCMAKNLILKTFSTRQNHLQVLFGDPKNLRPSANSELMNWMLSPPALLDGLSVSALNARLRMSARCKRGRWCSSVDRVALLADIAWQPRTAVVIGERAGQNVRCSPTLPLAACDLAPGITSLISSGDESCQSFSHQFVILQNLGFYNES